MCTWPQTSLKFSVHCFLPLFQLEMSIQERNELQNQLKEALAALDFERKDKRAREVRSSGWAVTRGSSYAWPVAAIAPLRDYTAARVTQLRHAQKGPSRSPQASLRSAQERAQERSSERCVYGNKAGWPRTAMPPPAASRALRLPAADRPVLLSSAASLLQHLRLWPRDRRGAEGAGAFGASGGPHGPASGR